MPRLCNPWQSNVTRALGCHSTAIQSVVFRPWSRFRRTSPPHTFDLPFQVPDTSKNVLQDRVDSLHHLLRNREGRGLRDDVSSTRCRRGRGRRSVHQHTIRGVVN